MWSLGLLTAVSMGLSWLLTPRVRDACLARGWVDLPDAERKLHQIAVPRLGGAAIALAYLLGLALVGMLPVSAGAVVRAEGAGMAGVLVGAAVVFAAGVVDDLRGLRPWTKLAFEFAAASLVFALGVRIGEAWWSFPVTLIWLVGCANAFNLIDGVDGLAAGVGLFGTGAMLIAALLHGNYPLAIATAPLVGALAGFLRYNFEPASIYLGDGGSLTIGFLLGCFGVVWSYKSAVAVGMTAPLILLALPWLDVALAVARRFLMMQPIFGADRGHIHHRLLARGLRPRHVALLAYLACGVAGVFSLVHAGMDSRFGWLVMAAFVGLIWLAVDRLGYAEFRVATRALMGGRLRRFVRQEILADRLAADLRGARSLDEYWDRLRDFGRQAGFGSLWLRMGDRDFTHEYAKAAVGYSWETRIPLAGSNYVAFRGDSRDLDMAQVLIPLALALRSAMPEGGVVPPHRASGSDRCAETGSRSPVETR